MQELCLLCWVVLVGLVQACPKPCDCGEKYGFQIADCAYRDLEAVPPGFPANVTTLSLSANRLPSLPEGAFREVLLLQSLWLAHNEIRTVAAGALALWAISRAWTSATTSSLTLPGVTCTTSAPSSCSRWTATS